MPGMMIFVAQRVSRRADPGPPHLGHTEEESGDPRPIAIAFGARTAGNTSPAGLQQRLHVKVPDAAVQGHASVLQAVHRSGAALLDQLVEEEPSLYQAIRSCCFVEPQVALNTPPLMSGASVQEGQKMAWPLCWGLQMMALPCAGHYFSALRLLAIA